MELRRDLSPGTLWGLQDWPKHSFSMLQQNLSSGDTAMVCDAWVSKRARAKIPRMARGITGFQ